MENITVTELKERLDNGEKLNLIDVRQPEEVATFNIGGINVPLKKIQEMEIDEIAGLADKEVICYCRSGGRSARACQFLEDQGFTNVKNMVGGVLAWQKM